MRNSLCHVNVISFDKSVCTDLQAGLSQEWLETNGLGGFACGTLAGANTRRYHGLLTAALNPPGGRMLLLYESPLRIRWSRDRSADRREAVRI
jgi:glycogen debranching enzyme